MYDTPQFEIPAAVREIAERNVAQVRQAYDQLFSLVRKSQDTIMKSQGAMAMSAIEIQSKALQFAQANIESNFRVAGDLAQARDIKQYLDIQTKYAKDQLETYARQAQEITRLMADAAHKSQPRG